MSEFIKKNQYFISSKDAKAIGKTGLYEKLDKSMVEFFNEICKAILNGDDEIYVIQWAISKLDDDEKKTVLENIEIPH